MTYDPNEDWHLPQPISAADELSEVDTVYGRMEKWRARAMQIGWFQRVADSMRNNGVGASAPPEEAHPPPLAADAEEPSPAVDTEWLDAIDKAVDALTARVDRLERRRAAEAALDALETEIERMLPPSKDEGYDDDVFEPAIKH